MPKREPARHTTAGEPPGPKVKMRLGPDGRWMPVLPPAETTETTEAAERPPMPDDPRPAAVRNAPQYGG